VVNPVQARRGSLSGKGRQYLDLISSSRWGVAKLVKAADFDSAIRGFESFLPSHIDP
jgi:hypothetical protein